MRILMLAEVSANNVIGGAERVLREQSIGLGRLGHEIKLVSRMPRNDARPYISFENIEEFRYKASTHNPATFVCSSVAGSIRAFDMACAGKKFDAAIIHQSLAGLGPLFRRHKNVKRWIYCYHSSSHEEYLIRRNAEKFAPIKQVATKLQSHIRLMIERAVLKRCSAKIVLSEFSARRIELHHGIPYSCMSIVPGAADTIRFHPADNRTALRKQLGIPGNITFLFTIRNLEPRMGLENLINAVGMLNAKLRDKIFLLIGGTGSLSGKLNRQINTLKLANCIKLAGFIPEQELQAYYQSADLMVLPTAAIEGFGLVIAESLACGTPALGTPVGAIPEIINRLDPHLVMRGITPCDIATGLTKTLEIISQNPPLWQSLRKKSRELTETFYNWNAHCAGIEKVVKGD